MDNSEIIIFLAENRECTQTNDFRSYKSIPNSAIETRFNSIIGFTDNTLNPQKSSKLISDNALVLILLPLVGAVEASLNNHASIVDSGEIAYFFVHKNQEIIIQNPYQNDLVNYLEIRLRMRLYGENNFLVNKFNLGDKENILIDISITDSKEKVFVGKFKGREEGYLQEYENIFAFVINGVFEVENRLIESRSGLEFFKTGAIAFEGLGTENIILFICK